MIERYENNEWITMNEWIEVIKYMSPFGLVAFVVIWWTLKVAPTLEASTKEVRQDFLAAYENQRKDYLSERAADRVTKDKLAAGFQALAEVTKEHVTEARAVWKSRGEA